MIESTAAEIVQSTHYARIELTADDEMVMRASAAMLDRAIKAGQPVYGLTRGFGPLVQYAADDEGAEQGLNLINHLAAGHGPDLPPETTRLMIRLRLEGMKRGYSAVHPEDWRVLANAYNAGFLPVVPARGSVSASGDLVPLAHAALAFAGRGEAWIESGDSYKKIAATAALSRLQLEPARWDARDALAFVNGSSASLASALENHVSIRCMAWIAAVLTGRIVDLLEANSEPYADIVVEARGSFAGHQIASQWVRDELTIALRDSKARSLQEPYSLRCAPQIIGSVLDHLGTTESLLVQEAQGCSDNPVVAAESIFHAGNFHAVNTGIVADLHPVLIQQLCFLAERQLALVLEPASNGGLPPLLASRPGETSGLAGLQLAASAMLAEVRQKSSPITVMAVPTNLSNQDIVPMSLIGCIRSREQIELTSLVLGSLAVAVAQLHHIKRVAASRPWWSNILDLSPRLEADRPLSAEVLAIRDILLAQAQLHCTESQDRREKTLKSFA